MQLNLIFNSDYDQYTGSKAGNAKIAYTTSYLWRSAKELFQLHVDETTGAITLPTWASYVAAMKALFDNPRTYQTAYTKISSLNHERDFSSYHAAFVLLATIFGFDKRTRI